MSQAGISSNGGGPTPPASPPAYGQVYNQAVQDVLSGANWTFDSNGPLLNISHVAGSDSITINAAGTYLITFVTATADDYQQSQLLVNGIAVPQASFGVAPDHIGDPVTVNAIVNLNSGDVVQIKNTTSNDIFLAGGAPYMNASLTFEKMPSGGASSGTNTLVGNIGSATQVAGIINVITGNSTVLTEGSGNTLLMDFARTTNLILGSDAAGIALASQNVGVGNNSLNGITNGISNAALGYQALQTNSVGSANTGIGASSLAALISGNHNTAIGNESMEIATHCSDNTALGSTALSLLTTGNNNIAIGQGAGTAYTTESNNIVIGLAGVAADSAVTRIGNIYGTTVGGTNAVAIIDNTGKLGTVGGGALFIATITGNTGGPEAPAAGNFNIVTANTTVKFNGSAATETLDFNVNNLLLGTAGSIAGGTDNTAVGQLAGANITSGSDNTAIGFEALVSTTTGSNNTAIGSFSLWQATTTAGNPANNNTALGYLSLGSLTTGDSNIAIGVNSGASYTTESGNIVIDNTGTPADSAVIRIGGSQTSCYIKGIDGVNVGSVARVVTEASDKLGTATITASTNISVTPGANTISIAALGGGAVLWSVIAANQTAAVNNGYFCNKAGTLALALPASSAVGDVIEVTNENTALGVQFTQAAGQQILLPNNTSTTLGATGTLTSSAIGDSMKIVCKTANTVWRVSSMCGNWTPA